MYYRQPKAMPQGFKPFQSPLPTLSCHLSPPSSPSQPLSTTPPHYFYPLQTPDLPATEGVADSRATGPTSHGLVTPRHLAHGFDIHGPIGHSLATTRPTVKPRVHLTHFWTASCCMSGQRVARTWPTGLGVANPWAFWKHRELPLWGILPVGQGGGDSPR